jgi:antitoxin Phd
MIKTMQKEAIFMVKMNNLVSISETKQNFSRITRLVDKNGSAVILENDVPRYIVLAYATQKPKRIKKTPLKTTSSITEIEDVRLLLHKEMSDKGTLKMPATVGDGWEAHAKERYAQH